MFITRRADAGSSAEIGSSAIRIFDRWASVRGDRRALLLTARQGRGALMADLRDADAGKGAARCVALGPDRHGDIAESLGPAITL
jgi:hypothetical protein